MRTSISLLSLLVVLSACSKDPATSVQVIIDADQAIRDDADALQIYVGGRAIGATEVEDALDRTVSAPIDWPVRISVAPRADDPDREFVVAATTTMGGRFLAQVSVQSRYVVGETREVRLYLRNSCRGVRCPATDSLTCESGSCVSSAVPPSELDPYVERDAGVLPPDDATVDSATDGPTDTGPVDTDGDGILDTDEGRAANRNTDGDAYPDYRDLDSDADGLPDRFEAEGSTSPTSADTDMDGASDLIEVALMTDPTVRADNPDVRGIHVILAPEGVAPEPSTTLIEQAAPTRPLDVYFLIEATGSMGTSIDQVRASITTGTVGSCMGGIIGGIRCARSDLQTGVGIFGDYPVNPYGAAASADSPYQHLKDVDGSDAATRTAVNGIMLGFGADGPEAHLSALHAVATGSGLHTYVTDRMDCMGGRFYPCFRPMSVPVVVMITDSVAHDFPGTAANYDPALLGFTPPTYMETIDAMNAAAIRFVGVNVGVGAVTPQLVRIANDTNSADRAGFPWVQAAPAAMIPTAVVDLVRQAAQLTVSAEVVDAMPAPPDAANAFIDRIVARTTTAGACATGLMTEDRMGIDDDTFHETFFQVPEGQTLCWDLVAKTNTAISQTAMPQVFQLGVRLVDERLTQLFVQPVSVIVPPLDPGGVE